MPSILVDTNTDGTVIVAAPESGQFIRVLAINLTSAGQVTVTLKSGSTVIWKTYATEDPNVLGGIVVPPNQTIDCSPAEALVLGLDGAVSVAGTIQYIILGLPQ